MKKIFILAIILLSGTAAASAQEFLTINPDVRTAGMANASVATTGGAYSVFQNAASSLFSHNLFEVGFSYSPWMRDVKKGYDLMAFGGFYSFNHKHSISFGTRFYREPKLSPDDEDYPFIPKDENNNPIVGIEAFRPLSVSADLAYSYRIGRYLGLSVTARYIRSSYGELFTNNALGFDVAAYARIPLNRMLEGAWVSAGAKISDFGFTFDDSNYDLPTKFSVGGSLFAPIRDSHSLEASVDLGYRYSSSENKSFGMGIGVEYVLMQMIAVRGGTSPTATDTTTVRSVRDCGSCIWSSISPTCSPPRSAPGATPTRWELDFTSDSDVRRTKYSGSHRHTDSIRRKRVHFSMHSFSFSAISSYLFSNSSSSVRQPSSSISSTSSNPSCPS